MTPKYKHINEPYDGRVIESWPDTLVLVWGVLLFEGTILTLLVSIGLARHRNGGSLRFSVELYSACQQLKCKNNFIQFFFLLKIPTCTVVAVILLGRFFFGGGRGGIKHVKFRVSTSS